MFYLDIKTYLVDDILTKVDRASMANSLEARVPLLDHKVVEFAYALPLRYKLRGRSTKYLLEEPCSDIFPQAHLNSTSGASASRSVPWMRRDLRAWTDDENI